MTPEIWTHEFEFAHGRRPSGRGGWAFLFGEGRDVEPEWAPGGGQLYGEAKRWAIAEAKRRGVPVVRVAT